MLYQVVWRTVQRGLYIALDMVINFLESLQDKLAEEGPSDKSKR